MGASDVVGTLEDLMQTGNQTVTGGGRGQMKQRGTSASSLLPTGAYTNKPVERRSRLRAAAACGQFEIYAAS